MVLPPQNPGIRSRPSSSASMSAGAASQYPQGQTRNKTGVSCGSGRNSSTLISPPHFGQVRRMADKIGRIGCFSPLVITNRPGTYSDALPNWRMRWCTRVLKIEPFNAHLMESRPAVSYVGLRADEPEDVRRGTVFGNVDGITQRFPLREWGWTINDVWEYLDTKGVTIPARTDCARCFFQTLGEWWWLWKNNPETYLEAESEEESTGHTFRSPQRDTWPTSLADLRREFEKDHIPKGAGQLDLMGGRPNMCRVCSL